MLATLYSADKANLLQRTERKKKVLAVDDNFAALVSLQQQLTELGYEVATARHGGQACEILELQPAAADVVIIDRRMPVLDGIGAVQRLKKNPHLRHIPVIMLTAADNTNEIREGLQAGVFYYLAKPVRLDTLSAVLVGAMHEVAKRRALVETAHRADSCADLMTLGRYAFRTPHEAEMLSLHLSKMLPDPARALSGIAELLANAIEHGNLEIGFAAKSALLEKGAFESEVEARLKSLTYASRKAEVLIERKDDGVYLSITDQGPGFDWQKFVGINFSRASHSHGRGIARARALSFDKLWYNSAGNCVVTFTSRKAAIDW